MKIQNIQKNLKQGFTLLELLIVVVIIGILAAIALPQYKKAVAKAELAQVLGITRSFLNSAQNYYLLNDNFTNNISALDISINDANTKCALASDSSAQYVLCANKRFGIWARFSSGKPAITIIGTNTLDENSALLYAAKEFFGGNCNCYTGTSTSSVCKHIGMKEGCMSCSGTKYL